AQQARQPAVLDAGDRSGAQPRALGQLAHERVERRQEDLGSHARAAQHVQPAVRLTLAERVLHRLAETQLTLDQRPPTATAPGASPRIELDHVRHAATLAGEHASPPKALTPAE